MRLVLDTGCYLAGRSHRLGRIGFDAAWRLLDSRGIVVRPRPLFGHGVLYRTEGPTVIGSYHPSRQNTNTGKLTAAMLASVFDLARREIARRRV